MDRYYRKSLALIHDKYFGDLAREAAQELVKQVRLGQHGYELMDVGCGSGILAAIASEAGFRVTGIDISEDFLTIARLRAPHARFFHASLFDFPYPRTDVVTAIGEPVNYLFDNKSSYEEAQVFFMKVYDCLRTPGLFIFDILTTQVDMQVPPRIIEHDDTTLFVEIEVDTNASVLTRKMTYFTQVADLYVKDSEVHRQFLFDHDIIISQLESIGFHVSWTTNYNGHNLRKGHVALICRKY